MTLWSTRICDAARVHPDVAIASWMPLPLVSGPVAGLTSRKVSANPGVPTFLATTRPWPTLLEPR